MTSNETSSLAEIGKISFPWFLARRPEPNDTIPQAIETGLSSTDPTFRFISRIGNNRNIPATSDVDFFKVQLNAGDTITIDIDADKLRSPLDSILRLFDSTGNEVARSDDNPAPGELLRRDSYIDFTASSSDSYYIGVSSFANFSYDPFVEGSGSGETTGFYRIELTLEEDLGTFESNDSIPEATKTGLDGSGSQFFSESAFIGDGRFGDTNGDYDFFQLRAQQGDLIRISTDAEFRSGLDTVIGLYNSTGNLLDFNDNGDFGTDSFLEFTAEVTDDYYAVVLGAGSGFPTNPLKSGTGGGVGSTGTYGVFLEIEDGFFGAFEPNDSIGEATETGLDGSGSQFFSESAFVGDGDFGDTNGDYDFFQLRAQQGDLIRISTDAEFRSGLDTVVGLYDSDGNLLDSNDNGDFGTDSELEFIAEATDDYYAVVLGAGSDFPTDPFSPSTGGGVGSTGSYGVSIEIEDGFFGAFEPNDSIGEATETGLDGSGSQFFNAFIGDGDFGETTGDYDFFKLRAQQGDTIRIDTNAEFFGNLDTVVGLYDSDGNLLDSNDNDDFGTDSELEFTAEATDDYYAVVWGAGSDFPTDPFTPGTGGGVGRTGNYEVFLEIEDGFFGAFEPNDSIGEATETGLDGSDSQFFNGSCPFSRRSTKWDICDKVCGSNSRYPGQTHLVNKNVSISINPKIIALIPAY